jgi:hypothetical protein
MHVVAAHRQPISTPSASADINRAWCLAATYAEAGGTWNRYAPGDHNQ